MTRKVILIGSPNCGKSLLFNRLTGLSQKVANFPGITVEVASGHFSELEDTTLVDYPGTYSLQPISGEEQVAVEQFQRGLEDPDVSHVLCLIDVTRLEKSLYFTPQVIRECERRGKPVLVLANMMDILAGHGLEVDLEGLSRELSAPVLPISARTGKGVPELLCRLRGETAVEGDPWPHDDGVAHTPDVILRGNAHQLARKYGPRGDLLVRTQTRLDAFFLHTAFGGLAFFAIMYLLFQSIFTWAASAIPGIYAARSIDSPRKRLLTYLAIPLMPCSARLPVYTLLIGAFIPDTTALGGLVGLQGLAMFGVYFFGMFCGLLVTGLVSRSRADHFTDLPFVLEMPPYRLPAWVPLLRKAWQRCKHFITKAGGIILTVTVVVWFLGYFPNGGADLGSSWLGQLGRVVGPLFEPLALDWRHGVAILTSFLAREVFVGTLGAMFGIESAEENMVPLVNTIQASDLGLASGLALLVFFAIALMCVSTMAILSREAGSWRLPLQMFAAYGVAGYLGALAVYQLVTFVGG